MENNQIIGGKVKGIRESRNLTIDDVSERSGVSTEQIQRIEDNIEIPSLAPLIKIARALGVRLGTFLDDQKELGPVVNRAGNVSERNTIRFTNDYAAARNHMEYHSLSQNKAGRHIDPFRIDIAASEQTDFIPSSHEGEEFIYVLEGTIEVIYGKDNYTLEAGDSIYYDSVVAHHVHACGNGAARILGVVYTPF